MYNDMYNYNDFFFFFIFCNRQLDVEVNLIVLVHTSVSTVSVSPHVRQMVAVVARKPTVTESTIKPYVNVHRE